MNIKQEAARLVRHALVPVAILLVERGWLPAAAQESFIEAGVIVVSIGATLVWSKVSVAGAVSNVVVDALAGEAKRTLIQRILRK